MPPEAPQDKPPSRRGAAPGERRGGRSKGTVNKKTALKRLLVEVLSEPDAQRLVGAIVKTEVKQPSSPAQRKAVEVLGEFMEAIRGVAARAQNELAQLYLAQPAALDANSPKELVAEHKDWKKKVAALEDKFEKWAELTVMTSSKLAPFENPTFRAVMVSLPAGDQNTKPDNASNVIQIDDPVAAARVYRRIVSAGARR